MLAKIRRKKEGDIANIGQGIRHPRAQIGGKDRRIRKTMSDDKSCEPAVIYEQIILQLFKNIIMFSQRKQGNCCGKVSK